MADDRIDLTIQLIDKLTGPAKRMTRGLAGLRQRTESIQNPLSATTKSVTHLTGTFRDASGMLRDARGRLVGVGRAMDGATQKAARSSVVMRGLGVAGTAAAQSLGQAAHSAAAAVLRIGAAYARSTVEALLFRDSSLRGLQLIRGDAFKAGEAFDTALNLSDRLGTAPMKTIESIQRLLAKGFTLEGAEDIFKGLTDLKVAVPTANLDNAVLAIEQIKSKGVLAMEELRGQLAESGLNVAHVLEEIGKPIGKNAREVEKMISQGEISADQGIMGILNSIRRLTGKELGQAAEEASKSVSGLVERFKQLPERLNIEIASQLEFSGAGDALSELWNQLGPGSEAFRTLTDFGVRAIKAIGEVIMLSIPLVKEFFKAFGAGFVESGGVESLRATWDGLTERMKDPAFLETVRSFGTRFGAAATLITRLMGLVVRIIPPLIELADLIQRPFDVVRMVISEVIEQAATWGPRIIDGLVVGIRAGVEKVKAAASVVAEAVTGVFDRVFQFGSPSKVMEGLGGFVGAGFERGIEASMPAVIETPRIETPALPNVEALAAPDVARPVVPEPELPKVPQLDIMTAEPMFKLPNLDLAPPNITPELTQPQMGEPEPLGPLADGGMSASAAGAAAAETAGSSVQASIRVGDIRIDGRPDDPKATAEAVRRVLASELGAAFEEIAIEAGA